MCWVEGWFPLEQVPALLPTARVACAAVPVQPPELMLEQVLVPVVLVLEARLLLVVLRSAESQSVVSQSAVL